MVSQANNIVFDNAVLQIHPFYADYHSFLHDISLKDYPRKNYFRADVDAIDLDKFEAGRAIANRDMTMDAVVGIGDYSNNHVVNTRLLLLELRMDYDSTNSLKAKSLRGKINHSRLALGASVRIDDENVFVFRVDVAEQAKKWMFSMSKEHPDATKWVAMSTEELDNLLQSQASMPYQPINDMSSVKADVCSEVIAQELESVLNLIDYWNKKAEHYKLQYLVMEEKHIKDSLAEAWHLGKSSVSSFSQDKMIYVELIEEEYRYLR